MPTVVPLTKHHGHLMPDFKVVEHKVLKPVEKGDEAGVRRRAKIIPRIYQQFRDAGYEGAIIKDRSRPWRAARTRDMMRLKPTQTVDVKITNWFSGRKGTSIEHILGGFVCETEKGVSIRVGGGFKLHERESFWAKRKQLVGRTIEVEWMEAAVGIKARHTNFKRLRPVGDKEV